MRLLRWFRDNPIVLLVVALAGFGAWIVSDLTSPPARRPTVTGANELGHLTKPLPPPPTPDGRTVPRGTLAQLKPGMSRVEVDELLGTPQPDHLGPITVQDGCPIYLVTYKVDLRPVAVPRVSRVPVLAPPTPDSSPHTQTLTLEFDASRQGHPLRRIQFPEHRGPKTAATAL
jgi:hypothetical protein